MDQTSAAPVAPPLEPAGATAADDAALYRSFNRSVVVSGIRCTLTYLLLPYVAPLLGLTGGLGPGLGLAIGAVAVAANVFTIRRFWVARHRWRWLVTAVSSAVLVLLAVMAWHDLAALLG